MATASGDEIVPVTTADDSGRQRLSETEMRGLARAGSSADAVAAGLSRKKVMEDLDTRPVLVSSPRPFLPRTFLGFTLFTISGTYVPLATGVFLAVNITFLGFAYVPPKSALSLASECTIVRADVTDLYNLLAVGLVFSVCQVLASSLVKGTLEAQEDARKQQQQQAPVPARAARRCVVVVVLCRVGVAVAAICLGVSMLCSIQGLLLAVSVRLGKFTCWAGATKGLFVAGTSIASLLAGYCVL